MISEYIKIAITNITHRKIRSWLTLLGIIVGVIAVVALVSLSQGMQAAVKEQFKKLGSNRIIVNAGGKSFGPIGTELVTAKLSEKDIKAINTVKGIEAKMGTLMRTSRVEFKGETKPVTVNAIPLDTEARRIIEKTSFFQVAEGRQIKQGDKYAVVIGHKIAYDLFDKDIKLGDSIKINGQEFRVVGIKKETGTPHDLLTIIPLDTARALFNEPEEVSAIYITVSENLVPAEIAEDVKKALRSSRGVEEGKEDFTVSTAENIVSSFKTILNIVQAVLIGIAAISILVGAIGITNTMYTSVVERTKDIGVMKTTGAKNSDIAMIFLTESSLLGFIGGLLGVVIGTMIRKTASTLAFEFGAITLDTRITPMLVISMLVFSTAVGAISGILPARRAAALQPVEALRK